MSLLWKTSAISAILSIAAASAIDVWLEGRIAIIGAFAGLKYSLNPGIAWGIQLPQGVQEVAIFLALVAVAFMAKSASSRTSFVAYGMILGGGVANIVDRIRDGYVTDFIQIGNFPIFNVADTCVSIGVFLLLFLSLTEKKL